MCKGAQASRRLYMDQAAEILCNLVCFASKQPLVDFVSVPPIGHRSTGGGGGSGGAGGASASP